MTCVEQPQEVETSLQLVADLLGVSVETAATEMRAGLITGVVERGEGPDAGRTRLTFFRGGRRARLVLARTGAVIQKSCVDFGSVERRRGSGVTPL